jgi:hypothetical protein
MHDFGIPQLLTAQALVMLAMSSHSLQVAGDDKTQRQQDIVATALVTPVVLRGPFKP